MSILVPQNFYKETVAVAWATGGGNFYVSTKPTVSAGYLVLSASNSSLREIVKFTATGTDGTGDYVTVDAADRGLGGTTEQTHAVGETVYMNVTAQTIQELSDAIDQIVAAGAQDASTSTKGIVKLSVAPVSASEPIAVGPNDPNLPDAGLLAFMATLTGTVFPFAGTSVPSGFLECNGASFSIETYPELALVLVGRFGLPTGTDFTADAGTDVLTATSHGLSDNDQVILSSTNTLPAGLSVNTIYYVISATTNTFQLSTTEGGSAVDITDTGTGTHSFHTSQYLPNLNGSVIVGRGQKTKAFNFVDADVNTSTDVITVEENDFLYTGQAVVLSTTGTLPTGLSAGTYYVIKVSSTTIKLATSRANADDGTDVDITAASGGGTHTLTLTVNATSRSLGDEGGEELHTLQTEELASHYHLSSVDSSSSGTESLTGSPDSGSYVDDDTRTSAVGGDTPHNNMPPYVALNYIIKT